MDPLVKAALDKLNEKVGAISRLKESDYVTRELRRELASLSREERNRRLSSLPNQMTFEEAEEDAICEAQCTARALIAALETL